MPGVPGWVGVGCGCRLQEGVLGALPSVFPEKVVFWAPLVVAPLHLPPPLEGRVGRWEFLEDMLVVLLGVHRFGPGCWPGWPTCPWAAGAVGAWPCGRIPSAGAAHAGPQWLLGVRGGVACGGWAPAGPGYDGGCVGMRLWLPVGVGWLGGRRSGRRTGSGLRRTSSRGKRGDGVSTVLRGRVRQGWWCVWVPACLLCCISCPLIPGASYVVLFCPGAPGRGSGPRVVVVCCPAFLVVAG